MRILELSRPMIHTIDVFIISVPSNISFFFFFLSLHLTRIANQLGLYDFRGD